MIGVLLRFCGYARVPREAAALACRARLTWEREPSSPMVGVALRELEKFLRSAVS